MLNRLVIFLSLALSCPAMADTIAVIGTGSVGSALGPEFAAAGHSIVYGSRNPSLEKAQELAARTGHSASVVLPAEAAASADIVVLAVPGLKAADIAAGLGDLSGKIIIDPTNPLQRRDDGLLGIEPGISGAEKIQQAAPGAQVVKAFSTINWRYMVDPEAAGGPVTIPLAGNDSAAKDRVARLVRQLGLVPLDVGPLRNARHVEGMAVLLLNNMFTDSPVFNFYLRPDPPQ